MRVCLTVFASLLLTNSAIGQIFYHSTIVELDDATPPTLSRPGEVIPGTEDVLVEAGVNLDGFDLRGADLSGIVDGSFRGANLVRSRITDVTNADFGTANLNDSFLAGEMQNGVYRDASLINAGLRGDFTGSDFTGAELVEATLQHGQKFVATRFDGATFEQTELSGNFVGASFREASFRAISSNAMLQSLNGQFLRASFADAMFQNTDLNGSFLHADFRGAQFANSRLNGDFQYASFAGVDLTDVGFGNQFRGAARFLGTDFAHANLSGRGFSLTNFTNASFFGADLSDVSFDNNVTLFGVDFRQANLSNTRFKGGDLSLADVRQADFSTVTGGIRLRGATFDQFTVFPPEQAWSGDPEAEGMVYAPALAGDANLDDQVTFADFLLLSKSFGVSCVDTDLECWKLGDFDLDGGVGFTDFLLLSDSFSISRVVGTQAVPEPLCTMTLTGIILACVALRLRGSR